MTTPRDDTPKEYRQLRCPHGWVDVTQCEPCKTAAERDALQKEIDRLRIAAQAVIDRWNSPKWDWHKQGPTADLMAALHTALLPDNAPLIGGDSPPNRADCYATTVKDSLTTGDRE